MSQAKLGAYTVEFRNSEEYHKLKQEIFTQDTYYFETDNPQPVIIDGGAHIGMATLYFKKLYPHAKVIAIEPLPQNFRLLESNLWSNQLDDVETHNVALAGRENQAEFYFDLSGDDWFTTASFIEGAWTHTQKSQAVTVPTVPLATFLTQPIDFLKLDIEGTEEEVLFAAREALNQVRQLMVEFHPLPHQSLARTTKILEDRGFQVALWQKGKEVTRVKSGLVLIHAQKGK